jgi:hypothetical protein
MSFQLVWNLSEKEGFWTSQNDTYSYCKAILKATIDLTEKFPKSHSLYYGNGDDSTVTITT